MVLTDGLAIHVSPPQQDRYVLIPARDASLWRLSIISLTYNPGALCVELYERIPKMF